MGKLLFTETPTTKHVRSENYSFDFSKESGFFARWGKTKENIDDPKFAPSLELADIEITTICQGVTNHGKGPSPCRFCYKSNTPKGINMSLDTFKQLFDKIAKSRLLCQIALGADSNATSNPDLFSMMEYSRLNGVIPNITVAEITDETADKLVKLAGAVAVSRYADKNVCYDSVKRLTDRGLLQTNIHILVSRESYDWVMETLQDRLTDPRLSKLKAIVLLSLKKRGRGIGFNTLEPEKFRNIINFALKNNISIGLDSCSARRFLDVVKDSPHFQEFLTCVEPCESVCFSGFFDVNARFFPCSFTPGYDGWDDGLDVLYCDDFVKDVWNNPKTISFREKLLDTENKNCYGCRECVLFDID